MMNNTSQAFYIKLDDESCKQQEDFKTFKGYLICAMFSILLLFSVRFLFIIAQKANTAQYVNQNLPLISDSQQQMIEDQLFISNQMDQALNTYGQPKYNEISDKQQTNNQLKEEMLAKQDQKGYKIFNAYMMII